MPLRSLAFLLFFGGSSAAALVFPILGVICYLVLYHVYPQTTWWGTYLQPLGIRYAFVCGVCLSIGSVLNLNRTRFGRQFIHPVEWGVLLVFLTMLLSAATGVAWNYRSDFVIDKMMKVFLFLLVMSHVVVQKRHIWHVTIILTLMTLYLGHESKNAPLSAFTNNRLDGIGGPDFRESTGLAIHLFALLPFVAVLLRQKKVWLRVLAFFAACYGINAILLCRARSAFMAGLAAGIMALWYVPPRHRRWVVVTLMLASIGGLALSDKWFWERMTTIVNSAEERDKSSSIRLKIWAASLQLLREHPLGVGIGQFEREIGRYAGSVEETEPLDERETIARRDAHNTFVLCAAETGLPGLAAFILALSLSWGTLNRLNRRIRRDLLDTELFEWLIFANRLSILVYIVAGMFVSRYYTEGMWIFLMLPVCLSRAVENEIRAQNRDMLVVQAPASAKPGPNLPPRPLLLSGGG